MTPRDLSAATLERLGRLFPKDQRSEATNILVDANRAYEDAYGERNSAALERLNIAALKVSRGDLSKLKSAVDLMQIDYRDLLVSAGFAHDTKAHLAWLPGSN